MTFCRNLIGDRGLWWVDVDIASQRPDYAHAEPLYEGTYTRIWRHPDRPGLVSKLSRVKTAPRDNVRKYWSCQAQREITANRIMQRLGIRTADLLGLGIRLVPWARAESLLFMRELPAHDTLRVVLRNTTDETRRYRLLERVAADIAALYRSGYHHKDCHLENVLRLRGVSPDTPADGGREQLVWIDNDLRYSRRMDRAERRLDASLRQLVDTSPDFISKAEWRAFAQMLSDHLGVTDWGRALAERSVAAFRRTI